MAIEDAGKLKQEQVMKTGGQVFMITIRTTQHKTWQGTVKWIEGNETVSFRSALELFKLMDGAVNASQLKASA